MPTTDKLDFLLSTSRELNASKSPEATARAKGKLDGFEGREVSKEHASKFGTNENNIAVAYTEGYREGVKAKSSAQSNPQKVLGLGRGKKSTRSRKTRSRKINRRKTARKH
jgi:hypothetical protein